MNAIFVAGTGTDVGKTYVACDIIRALRAGGAAVDAFKPIVSGFDEAALAASDPGRLLAALGRPQTAGAVHAISPWRFAAPLSPDQAARLEGREVALDAVVEACRARMLDVHPSLLVIEGAGGVMSPITETATCLDLMVALGAPVILVCGSYLGAISHTLTALEVLNARGLEVWMLMINETPGAPSVDGVMKSLGQFPHRSLQAAVGLRRDAAFSGWSTILSRLLQ